MSDPHPPLSPEPLPVKHLEFKAALLLALTLLLVAGSVVYVLFARGVFEPTQRVVLVADDSEGVTVGMDMTFAGFAIGRVSRIELADDGRAPRARRARAREARRVRDLSHSPDGTTPRG